MDVDEIEPKPMAVEGAPHADKGDQPMAVEGTPLTAPASEPMAVESTPHHAPLIWHQIQNRVFVNCVVENLEDVNVSIAESHLSLSATQYGRRLEIDVPLAREINVKESHWFANDRQVVIVLVKKEPDPGESTFWSALTHDHTLKKWIKPDLVNWVDEEDREYKSRAYMHV
jgi:hypothetical protein